MRGEMEKVYCREQVTPVGQVILGAMGGKLCLCDWKNGKRRMQNANRIKRLLKAELVAIPSSQEEPELLAEAFAIQDSLSVLDKTEKELVEYFAGSRQSFDIPLLLAGTDFQKSVWQALRVIPYGEVVTYMDVSQSIGNPQAIRAVSQAIGSNLLSILIPCHRVVGSNGALTGYAGGIEAKRCLLELENGQEMGKKWARKRAQKIINVW